jgi:hypothetical protein
MSEKTSGTLFGSIKDELETQIEARLQLLQLETTEKIAKITGIITVVLLAGLLVLMTVLCVSIMAGFYFSQVFDDFFYGFAVVAGFYLASFLVLVAWGRKKLATFVANKIIQIIFDDKDD